MSGNWWNPDERNKRNDWALPRMQIQITLTCNWRPFILYFFSHDTVNQQEDRKIMQEDEKEKIKESK